MLIVGSSEFRSLGSLDDCAQVSLNHWVQVNLVHWIYVNIVLTHILSQNCHIESIELQTIITLQNASQDVVTLIRIHF